MRGWDEGRREEKSLVSYHDQGRRLPVGGREQKSRWNESVSVSLQLYNFWTCCCQPLVTGELPKALSHPRQMAHCLACNTPGVPVLHGKFSLSPFTSCYKGLGGSKGAWDAVALPANLQCFAQLPGSTLNRARVWSLVKVPGQVRGQAELTIMKKDPLRPSVF